jgi:hypothetical protein
MLAGFWRAHHDFIVGANSPGLAEGEGNAEFPVFAQTDLRLLSHSGSPSISSTDLFLRRLSRKGGLLFG